jgi:anti-sigma regulatory factor (Ser/Thr protein kinase)
MPARTVALELEPAPDSVGKAREGLEGLRGTVPDRLLEDLRLLVSEIVTNSVRHAGLSPGDIVEVRVVADRRRVRVEVLDPGAGFVPPAEEPEAGSGSGWGLLLVARLADRWGVEHRDGHTRVWFQLDR